MIETGFSIAGGTLASMTDEELAHELQMVVDSGAKWVRFGMPAVQVEVTKGKRNWTGYERVATMASEKGLKCLGLLTSLPQWANTTNKAGAWHDGAKTPEQRAAFVAYAVDAASRFAGRIDHWEIWNEANSPNYWAGPSVVEYVSLLKEVYPAIKNANPWAVVHSTGCAGSRDLSTKMFFTGLYDNGAKDFFDVASMHPYPNSNSPAGSGEMAKLPIVMAIMEAKGDVAKKIWATEYGFPTGSFSATVTSEAKQAQLLLDLRDYWTKTGGDRVGPMLTYTLRDQVPTPTSREQSFGVAHHDGSPKPALPVLTERTKYDLHRETVLLDRMAGHAAVDTLADSTLSALDREHATVMSSLLGGTNGV